MLTKNERMRKLEEAGMNTGKYFTLNVDETIPAGAKIHIVVDKDGNYVPEVVTEKHDPILEQIIEDGYVRNTKLFRRFVMAQMFSALNYVSYDGKDKGYHACLRNNYSYDYTLKMMLEEVKVLSKLETRDIVSFKERSHFFTKEVIVAVLEDYIDKLKEYVDNLPNRNCKGVPYKRVKGVNIFNADIPKKLYTPLGYIILEVEYAKDYTAIHKALSKFIRDAIKLPYNTPKSKVWIDTFKGEGAFYTLKNLVMFHNCKVCYGNMGYNCTGMEAMDYINEKVDEYKGEGWRIFALMKKVIEDNGINTKTYISEICNK